MKTFEQRVTEEVERKLKESVEAEANRRIAHILRGVSFPPIPAPPSTITPTPPPARCYTQTSPSGSWIALTRDADTIIEQIETKSLGVVTRRLRIFKKLRDLLTAGAAPRYTVTKLLCEHEDASYNNLSGVVTQAIRRGVITVVALVKK